MRRLVLVLGLIFLFGISCTDNQRAKNFGGTATEKLPNGNKLVVATWKKDDLWLLTRPMRVDETAETYEFKESSSFGLLQGKVIIIEQK